MLLPLPTLPLAPPLRAHGATRTDGPSLNGALADTGRLLAVFSLLLAVGSCCREALARCGCRSRSSEPFVTASGVVAARELALLRLEDDDGAVGYGEAAPFEPYDGVALERVVAALSTAARRHGARPRRAPPRSWRCSTWRRAARAPARRAGRRGDRRSTDAAGRAARGGGAARAREGVREGFAASR